jgi:Domain of unknown function (DUF1937)
MLVHYLATPYEKYPHGIDQACEDAEIAAAAMIDAGYLVYCPIPHFHRIAKLTRKEPLISWLHMQIPYMEIARTLVVVMMPEWHESKGIAFEREYFEMHGKPIRYLRWPLADAGAEVELLLSHDAQPQTNIVPARRFL